MTISLKGTHYRLLEDLVEANQHKPSDTNICSNIECHEVDCDYCPFNELGGDVTLGDIRKERASRVSLTESHKGGGGILMTVALKDADIAVLKELVKQNENSAGSLRGCPDIKCLGVGCNDCPFLPARANTLGDVRKEVRNRITLTESHKGGGGIKPFRPECSASQAEHKDPIDQAVYSPNHYSVLDDIEAITLIARSMSTEQFKGYCLGNIIKYRIRLGGKDAVEQDLKKAQNYKDIFEKHKGLCYDYSE